MHSKQNFSLKYTANLASAAGRSTFWSYCLQMAETECLQIQNPEEIGLVVPTDINRTTQHDQLQSCL